MDSKQTLLRQLSRILWHRGATFLKNYWFKGLLVALVIYGFQQKEFNFEFSMRNIAMANQQSILENNKSQAIKPAALGLGAFLYNNKRSDDERSNQIQKKAELEPASQPSVCSFIFRNDPSSEHQLDTSLVAREYQLCKNYLKRFIPVAIGEQRKYGIPVSIKLAQALLESDAGQAPLAQMHNNHFGIQCTTDQQWGSDCRQISVKGTEASYRMYENAWTSFRMHSLLLQKQRYTPLHGIATSDYVAWAKGLEELGYSADEWYAEKLIRIIEFFELDKLG